VNADCPANNICHANACEPMVAPGAACNDNAQCGKSCDGLCGPHAPACCGGQYQLICGGPAQNKICCKSTGTPCGVSNAPCCSGVCNAGQCT
jgi:hypothetical protein